jgi:hypothetical protein
VWSLLPWWVHFISHAVTQMTNHIVAPPCMMLFALNICLQKTISEFIQVRNLSVVPIVLNKSFAQLGDLHRQWRNIWEDTLVKNTSSVIIFVLVFLCQLFYTFWGLLFLVFYTLAPSLFGLYRFLYLCVVPAYKPYIDSTSSNTSERKKLLRCTDNFFDTVHFLLYFYEHSTAQQLIS